MDLIITPLTLPLGLLCLTMFPIIHGAGYVYSKSINYPKIIEKLIDNPKDKYQKFQEEDAQFRGEFYLLQRALWEVRYQEWYMDFDFSQQMPQPFELEKEYMIEKNSLKSILRPSDGTKGERSLWTAKNLKKYAKKNKLNKLHYLGGLGHTSEIAYFIKNPRFSFKKLENYRLKKRDLKSS